MGWEDVYCSFVVGKKNMSEMAGIVIEKTERIIEEQIIKDSVTYDRFSHFGGLLFIRQKFSSKECDPCL